MKYSNIRQRVNFYQAGDTIKTVAKTAMKTGASAVPILGEAIDIVDIITGLATGNFTQVALSALGLILPGVSGSSLKAGREVVEALGKQSAQKLGKQLIKKIHPKAAKTIGIESKELKQLGQEIMDEVTIDDIAIKLQTPPKNIQSIKTFDQLKDREILKQFNLSKDEQTFLIEKLQNRESLPPTTQKSINLLFNKFKAASGSASDRAATEAAMKKLKKGVKPSEVDSLIRKEIQKKVKQQKDKAFRDKLDRSLFSRSGVEFNAGSRFQGIPFFKDQAQLDKHMDVWLRHVEDEYLDLADELVDRGDLIKEGKKWMGKFGDKFKAVDPVDYVMSRSKAFENARLQFSGTPYYSGMTSHPYHLFVKNGGTEAPMGIWTTSRRPVAEYYSQYSQSGRKSDGSGHVIDIVGPRIDEVVEATGATSGSFDKFGRTIADVAKDNPKALHIFSEYVDDLVPSEKQIKTVVYPTGTQVKSLRFNNGDFNMSDYFPFRKKGGNISYYEYICN